MTASPDPVPAVPGETKARELAESMRGMTMTAEVWDGDEDQTAATVVDVVRIGATLHFVVKLDD